MQTLTLKSDDGVSLAARLYRNEASSRSRTIPMPIRDLNKPIDEPKISSATDGRSLVRCRLIFRPKHLTGTIGSVCWPDIRKRNHRELSRSAGGLTSGARFRVEGDVVRQLLDEAASFSRWTYDA